MNKNTVFERCTAKRKKLPSTTKGNELRKDVEQLKPNLKLISMNEIQTEEVAWLWYPYLPRGKLTIIQGDPVVLADPSARL